MAEVKISDMTPGAALGGTELGEMVQGGATRSFTMSQVSTYAWTAPVFIGSINFTAAADGVTLKQGANGRTGTFTANETTPVVVDNTSVEAGDIILIGLHTVGGTVGALPTVKTITPTTGFTVAASASDTSQYSYVIIKSAA